MDLRERIQLVLDVIDGKQKPSALQAVLDDDYEVNVFRAAVDHLVTRTLSARDSNQSEYRFRVKEHDKETFTEWLPERSQFSTGMTMGQLRLAHPHAEIAVERRN